jgi:hypothetical protein
MPFLEVEFSPAKSVVLNALIMNSQDSLALFISIHSLTDSGQGRFSEHAIVKANIILGDLSLFQRGTYMTYPSDQVRLNHIKNHDNDPTNHHDCLCTLFTVKYF